MTSNTTPYGMASTSSTSNNTYAYMAFDDNDSTSWKSAVLASSGNIIYQFPQAVTVNKFMAKVKRSKNVSFKISDDGSTWETVHSWVISSDTLSETIYDLPTPKQCRYVALYMNGTFATQDYHVGHEVYSFQVYGK